MNRRILVFLLTLTLCLCAAFSALGQEAAALPAPGDKIGGFVVKSVTPIDVLGATGVLFEHEKNGAQLLYLASSDTNVAFDITFRTPALDEKGKPHVFEHMTICGSEKYPDANMFFPFYNKTYSTFVNALTYHGMTSYPVSSLSEEQLMTMMDYYLSGVFHPLVITEPRMVSREAWRYELNSADEPLNIAGTVYSEMQGALTPQRLANENNTSTMFKGGLTAHVSGGRPEAIRTLTYEELVAFHDEYYHPSNALIVLYGQLDYAKFIQYIDDEYISKFDRQEIYVERGQVEPYTETVYETYEAPVEAGANTEDASFLSYSFAKNDLSLQDVLSLDVLSSVIGSDASPVMRLLDERLPGVAVSCGVNIDSPAPTFVFNASAVNEDDRDTFVQAIDEGLAQMAAEGVNPDILDGVLSNAKLSLMLVAENSTLGYTASQGVALFWTYFDTVDYYNTYAKAIDETTVEGLNALLKTCLTENTYRGVSLTKPVAGLAEENAAALADELAKKKAAMTDEEMKAMIDDSASFAQWSAAPVDADLMAKVAIMTVDKLPENLPQYDIKDETTDGVRCITAEADVGDMAYTTILMDASHLPVERLRDVSVVVNLLGSIDTEKYAKEELSVLMDRYLGTFRTDIDASAGAVSDEPDRYDFSLVTLNLGENAAKGYELIAEILFHSDFSTSDDIKNLLSEAAYSIRSALDSNPLGIQLLRCEAMFSPTAAFNNYLGGVEMYEHLNELIALADSDPAALAARMESALELLLNSQNATMLCVGSADAVAAYTQEARNLLKQIPATETAPVDYSVLCLEKANDALVNNLTVHMNMTVAPADSFSGKCLPLAGLISDRYLIQLRNVLGAYGAYASFDQYYNFLYTYRDPNLDSTFEAFAALPELLRTDDITQAEVDTYIVGSYNQLLSTSGILSQAQECVSNYLRGVTDAQRLQWMREAKATTVEDVRAAAELIEALLANGVSSTSGAESTLAGSEEQFPNIVKIEDAATEQPAA